MRDKLTNLWNLTKDVKKETKVGIQSLILFLGILMAVHLGDTAIAVNSTYGDRELPIYSVDTEEKKIAISFDAAWGAGSLMEQNFTYKLLQKETSNTLYYREKSHI